MLGWFPSLDRGPDMDDPYDKHPHRSMDDDQEYLPQINFLQHELATKNSLVDKLQQELTAEKIFSAKIKESADKMQTALDNKEAFVGAQQSDDTILTGFRQLLGQVKTWVSTSLTVVPEVDTILGTKHFLCFQNVFPGQSVEWITADIVDRSKTRGFFFRGCVAEALCTEIFRAGDREFRSGKHDLWLAPDLSRGLAKLEDRLAASDMFYAYAYAFLLVQIAAKTSH